MKIKTILILLVSIQCYATSQELQGRFTIASERKLDTKDIENLTAKELYIMRNEISARHGYKFNTFGTTSYFNKQSWYRPIYSNVDSMLTDIEKYNINFLKQREDFLTNTYQHNQKVIYSDSSCILLEHLGQSFSTELVNYEIKRLIDLDIDHKFLIKKTEKYNSYYQVDISDITTKIELMKIGPVRAEKSYEIECNGLVSLIQGNGIVYCTENHIVGTGYATYKLYSINNPYYPFLMFNHQNQYSKIWDTKKSKYFWIGYYIFDDEIWEGYYLAQGFQKGTKEENEKIIIGTLILTDEFNLIKMFDVYMDTDDCCAERWMDLKISDYEILLNFPVPKESFKFEYFDGSIDLVEQHNKKIIIKERRRNLK